MPTSAMISVPGRISVWSSSSSRRTVCRRVSSVPVRLPRFQLQHNGHEIPVPHLLIEILLHRVVVMVVVFHTRVWRML